MMSDRSYLGAMWALGWFARLSLPANRSIWSSHVFAGWSNKVVCVFRVDHGNRCTRRHSKESMILFDTSKSEAQRVGSWSAVLQQALFNDGEIENFAPLTLLLFSLQ